MVGSVAVVVSINGSTCHRVLRVDHDHDHDDHDGRADGSDSDGQ